MILTLTSSFAVLTLTSSCIDLKIIWLLMLFIRNRFLLSFVCCACIFTNIICRRYYSDSCRFINSLWIFFNWHNFMSLHIFRTTHRVFNLQKRNTCHWYYFWYTLLWRVTFWTRRFWAITILNGLDNFSKRRTLVLLIPLHQSYHLK